jgi:hypothetical protein
MPSEAISVRQPQARRLVWLGAGLGIAALAAFYVRRVSQRRQDNEFTSSDWHPALGTAAMAQRDSRVRVHENITINAPIERVEERWTNLTSMPDSLRRLGELTGSPTERAVVEFRPGPVARGTEVRVELEYEPRGGAIGAALARVLGGDPTGQLRQDLRRFKQIVETGEVVLSEGPSLWRPAQPPETVQEVRPAAGVGV